MKFRSGSVWLCFCLVTCLTVSTLWAVTYSDDFEAYSDNEGAPWAGDKELPNWWTGAPLGGDGYEMARPDTPVEGNKALAIISGSAAPHFTVSEAGLIDDSSNIFEIQADIIAPTVYNADNPGGLFFNAQGDLTTLYKLDIIYDTNNLIAWRILRLSGATDINDYNPAGGYTSTTITRPTPSGAVNVKLTGTAIAAYHLELYNKSNPSNVYTFDWSDGTGSPLVGGYLGVQGHNWAEFYFDNITISGVLRVCGVNGYKLADLNTDCYVDFKDLALLAAEWLKCTMPDVPGCDM